MGKKLKKHLRIDKMYSREEFNMIYKNLNVNSFKIRDGP